MRRVVAVLLALLAVAAVPAPVEAGIPGDPGEPPSGDPVDYCARIQDPNVQPGNCL